MKIIDSCSLFINDNENLVEIHAFILQSFGQNETSGIADENIDFSKRPIPLCHQSIIAVYKTKVRYSLARDERKKGVSKWRKRTQARDQEKQEARERGGKRKRKLSLSLSLSFSLCTKKREREGGTGAGHPQVPYERRVRTSSGARAENPRDGSRHAEIYKGLRASLFGRGSQPPHERYFIQRGWRRFFFVSMSAAAAFS